MEIIGQEAIKPFRTMYRVDASTGEFATTFQRYYLATHLHTHRKTALYAVADTIKTIRRHRNTMSPSNKAAYMATEEACGWAGAVKNWVIQAFGQGPVNAEKANHDGGTDRPADGRTD